MQRMLDFLRNLAVRIVAIPPTTHCRMIVRRARITVAGSAIDPASELAPFPAVNLRPLSICAAVVAMGQADFVVKMS